MKKITLLLLTLSLFSCKKDPIERIMSNLEPVDIPSNVIGKWRWIESAGGFAGTCIKDSTKQRILTIQNKNRYQECENDKCFDGRWAYGSRVIESSNNTRSKDTILLLRLENNTFAQMVFKAKEIKDTLILNDDCDDCFSHTYIRIK